MNLVFDGGSFVVNASGEIIYQAESISGRSVFIRL